MQQVRYLFLLENAWIQHFNTICTRTGESLYWSQGALLLLHAYNRSTGDAYFNMHVVGCSSSKCTHRLIQHGLKWSSPASTMYKLCPHDTVSLNISRSFTGELHVWTPTMQFFSTPALSCRLPSVMCGLAEWHREGDAEMALKMECVVVLQNACGKSTWIFLILTQLLTSKVLVECTEIYRRDICGVFKA